MTKEKIDQMLALLQELHQIIEELDCGPLECSACVDTDDMAYIEVPIDGDGTARSLSDWAFALEVLVGLAHTDWATGQLYEAFCQALLQTSARSEDILPQWEDVEQLMAEQARLRRIYKNLIPFLEAPDAYAAALTKQVDELMLRGMSRDEARGQVAVDALKALAEELEMAYGERVTPDLYRAYVDHLEANGDNYVLWISRWLQKTEE
jgi:hypothetical protein